MPRIYLNQAVIVRLGPTEVVAGMKTVYELNKGWNEVPEQLLEHPYVKALIAQGGHPPIPDGKAEPAPAAQPGTIVPGTTDTITGAPVARPVAPAGGGVASGPGPVLPSAEPAPPTREEQPQPGPEHGDSKAQTDTQTAIDDAAKAQADVKFDHDGDGKPGGSKPGPRTKRPKK